MHYNFVNVNKKKFTDNFSVPYLYADVSKGGIHCSAKYLVSNLLTTHTDAMVTKTSTQTCSLKIRKEKTASCQLNIYKHV